MRCCRPLAGVSLLSVLIVGAVMTAPAAAQESAYCRQVRAQARATASVLAAPRVVASGIRFPSDNRIDLGPTVGRHTQVRVGATWSALDAVRARETMQASSELCTAQEASAALDTWTKQSLEAPLAQAYAAQASYLADQQPRWQALARTASGRFQSRLITAIDAEQVRRRASELELRLVHGRGEASQLAHQVAGSGAALARASIDAANTVAARESRLRRLDAWQVRAVAGAVPQTEGKTDWYGTVEVSYSLGGPLQTHHERQVREAARDYNAQPTSGPVAAFAELRPKLTAKLQQAREELRILADMLTELSTTLQQLEATDAGRASQHRDLLVLEEIALRSEHAFQQALSNGLNLLLNDARK